MERNESKEKKKDVRNEQMRIKYKILSSLVEGLMSFSKYTYSPNP
jgi:hypothetical protein